MLEHLQNTIAITPKITQIAAKTGLETVIPIFFKFFQQHPSNINAHIRILLKIILLKSKIIRLKSFVTVTLKIRPQYQL